MRNPLHKVDGTLKNHGQTFSMIVWKIFMILEIQLLSMEMGFPMKIILFGSADSQYDPKQRMIDTEKDQIIKGGNTTVYRQHQQDCQSLLYSCGTTL